MSRAHAGPDATSLRFRLREETRAAHERLDGSFAGLGEGGSIARYPHFLLVNEACHRAIEPAIGASGLMRLMPQMTGGERRIFALADLRALDLTPIDLPDFAIASPKIAQAIGIAYVLEGSRLGARMILKRIRGMRRVDIAAPLPTLFLEAAGTADRFRVFLDLADGIAATSTERDLAIEAANATFVYFLEAVRIADMALATAE